MARRAGTEMPLFEPAALEAVSQPTSGLPRDVNDHLKRGPPAII
jgi:hypothetical protein